ncbi:hypothetical protein QWY31_16105, partial [Cytophagales bacterium LB-30]
MNHYNKAIFSLLSVCILLLAGSSMALAQVTVTSGTVSNLCVGGDYLPLSDIVIDENGNGDFSVQAGTTIIYTLPAGYRFLPGVGSVSFTNGQNISAASIAVTSTTATITITVDQTNKGDVLTISGLVVRALPTAAVETVNLSRTGGTATITGNDAGGPTNISIATAKTDPPVVSFTNATCVGDAFGAISVTSGSNIRWYSDASLTNELTVADGLNPTALELGFDNSAASSKTVYATATDGVTTCESLPTAVSIQVYSNPTITPIADVLYCPGDLVNIDISSSSGSSFSWTRDNLTNNSFAASGAGDIVFIAPANTSGTDEVFTIDITAELDAFNTCTANTSFQLTLASAPVAPTLGVYSPAICVGDAFPAVNVTSGANLKWYSDALLTNLLLVSDGANPDLSGELSFNNASAGTYKAYVTQTNVNGCESAAAELSIAVVNNPTFPTISNITVCPGEAILVDFTPQSGSLLSWTNDNTNTGIAATGMTDISVTASENTTGGSYVSNISAIAELNGCNTEINFTVTVLNRENAPTITPYTNAICEGGSFDAISVSGSALQWYSDSDLLTPVVTSDASNPDLLGELGFDNNTPGIYKAYVTGTINGCESEARELSITVNANPVFPAPSDEAFCPGDLIYIDFTPESGASVTWTNSLTSTGITASGSGDIIAVAASNTSGSDRVSTITAIASKNGCQTVHVFTITVHSTPSIEPWLTPVDVCSNETAFDLSSIALIGNPLGGSFSFSGTGVLGDNMTLDATVFVTSGIKSITVEYTDPINNCVVSQPMNLVNIVTSAGIDIGSDFTICSSDTPNLSATLSGSASTITWSTSGDGSFSNTGIVNPVYTPGATDKSLGTVDITATTNDPDGAGPCTSASQTITITINEAATVEAGTAQT